MRNDKDSEKLSTKLISLATKIPVFNINNLKLSGIKPDYVKKILSRYGKKGEFIKLKKGLYSSQVYLSQVKEWGKLTPFLEFLAGQIYSPSYLSLEYVLQEYNILTEAVFSFTSVTKNKTAGFPTKLGSFFYRKIKDELFLGFEVFKEGNFIVYKATKAKALFDYLYLRKNRFYDQLDLEELRLNLEEFSPREKKEFNKYVNIEASNKMNMIAKLLWSSK